MTAAVATQGLTKRFRSGQVAVRDLDLHVPAGAVYGFLGPNGSGKTTTIRMLLGLVAPTSGDAELLGEAMPARRAGVLPRVGALVEGPAFHPYLSGRDNLRRADAADRTVDPRTSAARIDAALERVGLSAAATKRYRVYSLGMRQRLGLAAALLRPRELLVLDEPTNGLDPQGTREVRTLVRELAADGATVFVSTHLLAEVEQLCSHVGVMSAGQLVAQGTLAQVTAATGTRVRVEARDPRRAAAVLAEHGLSPATGTTGAAAGSAADGGAVVEAELAGADPERLLAALVASGAGVRQFALQRATLEDLFVTLTGEGFDVRA
ncbi:ABC transporter ATP-binding protein [Quadrisphaera sp. DSM 44207]|uniref:ABC transporter ATP-binding protein n=1 Tax=Quadrisphaera sp. DSM 44207 TaxID=1881057 RepID=UPI00088D7672|nr:ABC transporter ATP-binding protein [Quadrisphaera sp. DSM 44207]SDQ36600.1 ABC-2 type transport system ATP-binding protein [Quadrisphaera sp. DSM 44207]